MSFVQAILDAIALGALYALVAIGIALVFGVMRLVNFAHGELITAGAYALALTSDLPAVVSIATCLAVCVLLALAIEKVAFRRLREATPVTMLVATFAIAFVLEAIWLIAFTTNGRPVGVLSVLNQSITDGDLHLRWVTVVMIAAAALLLAGTAATLTRTSIGLQMRAAATDFSAARLLGVRADTVVSFAFVLAGVFAAVAAVLFTVRTPLVTPTFGLEITIVALVGAVVGGLDRLWTATAGGFFVGFTTAMLGEALPPDTRVYVTSLAYLLVIVVLLLRPQGMFAPFRHATAERV